jgi:hypothetical protein
MFWQDFCRRNDSFIFSSLAITAVGQAAMAMVEEVRRQFREIPGILEGKAQPEYEKCVAISTDAHQKNDVAGSYCYYFTFIDRVYFGLKYWEVLQELL